MTAASRKTYDLILMDCQMPEMSGFEAAAAIRSLEQTKGPGGHRVKIIALTANAVKGDRERCLASGMDDYLTKPLNPTKLIQCIESHGPPRDVSAPTLPVPVQSEIMTSAQAAVSTATIEKEVAEEVIVDYADLVARCDGDKVMMVRLIEKFKERSRQTYANLLACCKTGDAPGMALFAHALKGTSANLSAVKVSSLAAQLEDLGRSADLSTAEELAKKLGIELERCRKVFSEMTRGETQSVPSASSAKTI